jgi:predicted house-cleaning noncanonical NTP pyrophosphatase (MazG superfamily)
MKRYIHNKLVRDKIPEIIKATGNEGEVRVMGEREFEKELKKKLIEEARELLKTKKENLPKELADVLEVLKSIAEFYGIDFELIEEKQIKRRKERGGFKKRLFLVWSTQPAGK